MMLYVALALSLLGSILVKELTTWIILSGVLSNAIVSHNEVENVLQRYQAAINQGSINKNCPKIASIKQLEGSWKEDVTQRSNLEKFLCAVELNVFLRKAVMTGNWESTMNIVLGDNEVFANGTRGPQIEPFYDPKFFNFVVVDNATRTEASMKPIMSGMANVTAEIRNNSLIMYTLDPKTEQPFIITHVAVLPDTPDKLIMDVKHVPTNISTKSVYIRVLK